METHRDNGTKKQGEKKMGTRRNAVQTGLSLERGGERWSETGAKL